MAVVFAVVVETLFEGMQVLYNLRFWIGLCPLTLAFWTIDQARSADEIKRGWLWLGLAMIIMP